MDGLKTVEARKYKLTTYFNEDLWIIETPGKGKERSFIGVDGKVTEESDEPATFVSRIIGIVRFGESFHYTRDHWCADRESHRIPEGSYFDWQPNTTPKMYGWKVTSAQALVVPQQGPDVKGMKGCEAITRVALCSPPHS